MILMMMMKATVRKKEMQKKTKERFLFPEHQKLKKFKEQLVQKMIEFLPHCQNNLKMKKRNQLWVCN